MRSTLVLCVLCFLVLAVQVNCQYLPDDENVETRARGKFNIDAYLKRVFKILDKDNNNLLNGKELYGMRRRLYFSLIRRFSRWSMPFFDTNGDKGVNYDEFTKGAKLLRFPK